MKLDTQNQFARRKQVAQITSQLSALSRLFSSAVFRELATRGKSPIFARVVRESCAFNRGSYLESVRDIFESAFGLLKKNGSRDEYIYRAALTHRILLGKHNLKTACMLNEFRTGECRADVAILNGTTTVYEIKSERDSLNRLERQIESYKRVFASVVVITSECHVDDVLDLISPDVGLMCLSRRYQITTLREAKDRPDRICPIAVFEAIRTSEARDILIYLGIPLPSTPNIVLHAELRKVFERLRSMDVHEALLHTLKQSRTLTPLGMLIDRLPQSLHAAALSVPLRKGDHDRLVDAVNAPIEQAMSWA